MFLCLPVSASDGGLATLSHSSHPTFDKLKTIWVGSLRGGLQRMANRRRDQGRQVAKMRDDAILITTQTLLDSSLKMRQRYRPAPSALPQRAPLARGRNELRARNHYGTAPSALPQRNRLLGVGMNCSLRICLLELGFLLALSASRRRGLLAWLARHVSCYHSSQHT